MVENNFTIGPMNFLCYYVFPDVNLHDPVSSTSSATYAKKYEEQGAQQVTGSLDVRSSTSAVPNL